MTPILRIMRGDVDLMERMLPYFIRATYTDCVGDQNDEFEIELDDDARQIPLPIEDELVTVCAGYRETGVSMIGVFTVGPWETGCEHNGPETITITCRAATLSGEIKAGGLKHWDNAKLGTILEDTAKAAGLALAIHPSLASVMLPYALRWEASPIDFATRLAAEAGGIVKPAGGRLVVTKRGSGQGAGGSELPPIRVTRWGNSGWRIKGEPRPRHSAVVATYHDPKTGKRKSIRYSTGHKGPVHTVLHSRPSKDEAQRAAEARARELSMLTGGGHFTAPYDPAWSAGAKVIASGYGDGIDGVWCSTSISTTWAKGQPVLSTIEVQAKPEGKDGGSSGSGSSGGAGGEAGVPSVGSVA